MPTMMQEDHLLNLRYWQEMISRQRWVILACVLLVTIAAVSLSLARTPVYQATCSVYLNRQRVQPMNFQDIYTKQDSGRPTDQLLTQVEILKSTPILDRAVRDLEARGLLHYVDSTVPPKPTLSQRFCALIGTPVPRLPMTSDEKRAAAVRGLQNKISVATSGGNAFVAVSVSWDDPVTATELANAITSAYLKNDRELLHRSADEAIEWLSAKMHDQQAKLLEAEEKLRSFAGPTPRVEDMNQLAVQEMTGLQQALLEVKLRLLAAETSGVAASSSGAGAVPDANTALRIHSISKSSGPCATRRNVISSRSQPPSVS